jgi:dTDP-4-dehydrorhamnose 3,5-epimerase
MGPLGALPPGVLFTPLRQVPNPKGDILHALTAFDPCFHGFGEAYFTQIAPRASKGWKQHQRMVLNLVVPVGLVRFHFYDEQAGRASDAVLGAAPALYGRLTVPPGVWMAFSGLAPEASLVLNLASIAHDPAEARNLPLDAWPLSCEAPCAC